MALSDVSNILWRERRLLELLACKLEEARQHSHETGDVDKVLGVIKHIGLERSMLVADASRELGASGSPTLRELADLTPSPWGGIFAEHRRALLTLADEIDSITTLSGRTTDARNQPAPGRRRFLRMQTAQSQSTSNDLTMKQNLSEANASALQPSLTDFLK
jgi:hypothetical protein